MAAPRPSLDEDGRVHALAQVPQLLARGGQLVPHLVHIGACVRRDPVADTAQHQRLDDQALLDAIVQVPLDPPARLVRGGDDPGPRGGHLGLRLGIRDRGRGQLGEPGQPRLGTVRQRFVAVPRSDAPQAALDADRHADGRAEADLVGDVGAGPEASA